MRVGLFFLSFIVLVVTSCSIKRPGGDVPAPNISGVEKSFFTETSVDKSRSGGMSEKVFIGAWAPVTEIGSKGEAYEIGNAAVNYHANIVFKVEENNLLGKLVNPTYPNNSAKWETVITIPITKHYYYEKKKDKYGRDTTDYIENSVRSDWSARPMMKVNFAGTKIHKWAYALQYKNEAQTLAAEDVEWDKSRDFLAFTLTVSNGVSGSDYQAKYRFNFMGIDPAGSPGFVKTPYHPDNARYINILHLIGKKIDGVNSEYLAAHWDFQKPIDFYLNDFPERYQDIARDVIELWNDELQNLGYNRPLKPKFVQNPRYYFDLRKPSMTWMGDKRVSSNSPLGIGQAQANIFTGEIVWGGVMIWGGALEDYIKKNAPLGIGGSADGSSLSMHSPLDQIYALDDHTYNHGAALTDPQKKLVPYTASQLDKVPTKIQDMFKGGGEQEIGPWADSMVRRYSDLVRRQTDVKYDFPQMFKKPPADFVRKYFNLAESSPVGINPKDLVMNQLQFSGGAARSSFDNDVTFSSVSSQLSNAVFKMKEKKETFSIREGLRVFLKDLMIHEMGHLLGLGHNFKENILPEKGSVPDKYYDALKADADNGMKNYSTVMGYRHPFSVLDSTYDEIKVGPHDSLAMRYLYKQEFPIYEDGDEDFTYVKLGEDGRIDRSLNVSYFPTCNDLDASYYKDPYCNRHARGVDAMSIMRTHFDSIDYLLGKIQTAFTEHRTIHDPSRLELFLYSYAIQNMSRIRHFYDYMRLKYKDELYTLRGDESNLLYFSKVCSSDSTSSRHAALDKIFNDNPELKDLCRANKYAIEKMSSYLGIGGSDYSTVDRSASLTPGSLAVGDAAPGYDQFFGSWTSISPLYLKIMALYTLTQNYSFMSVGPFLMSNWEYSTFEDGAYSYFTLYPFELTKMVATAATSSMDLLSDDNDTAKLSRLNLYIGGMLNQARYYNNDQNTFINQGDYFDKLFRQHQFLGNFAFVMLKPNYVSGSLDRIHSFSAEQYQQFGNIPLGPAYILPNRRIIVDNTSKMIFPIMEPFFINKDLIYTVALILDYTNEFDDKFSGGSAKSRLTEIYSAELKKCVRNGADGLVDFFNSEMDVSTFEGFELAREIGSNSNAEKLFYDSLDKGYQRYEKETGRKIEDCLNVFTNLGLISSNAMVLNGGFFGEVLKYINKN